MSDEPNPTREATEDAMMFGTGWLQSDEAGGLRRVSPDEVDNDAGYTVTTEATTMTYGHDNQTDAIADALARLVEGLAEIATTVGSLEARIAALEARMIVQQGTVADFYGDSAPGTITQAEPNAPR